MGNKDWQRMDSKDDLAAMGVSPHRGRGWRIFSGVLFVTVLTFAVAYYLPLYRAHDSLSREYRALSVQASTQHQQLADTLDTLQRISVERDRLNTVAATKQKSSEALIPQAEGLERDLNTALKKYLGKGKVQVTRQQERLHVSLASPALVQATGADLTDPGKKSLCAVGGALKSADVHITVQGFAAGPVAEAATAWKLASARAAGAAQLLSETCGVAPGRVEVVVRDPSHAMEDAALSLEIAPH
jgi:flagellar motor protein MotB